MRLKRSTLPLVCSRRGRVRLWVIPGCGQGAAPEPGSVTRSVVGANSRDGDPVGVEEVLCSQPERGRGFLGLVGEDFGVGQASVVVDGVVQVAVAEVGATADLARPGGIAVRGLLRVADRPSVHFVAGEIGDVAQFS